MLDKSPESAEARREYNRQWMAKKRAGEKSREVLSADNPHTESTPESTESTPAPGLLSNDKPAEFAPAATPVTEQLAPFPDVQANDQEKSPAEDLHPVPDADRQDPARPEGQQETPRIDITRPPKRLPVRTKGIWQTLSIPLREDIIAREEEFDRAFAPYDGLGQYRLRAEAHGTTLQAAMRSYVALEDICRHDVCSPELTPWPRGSSSIQGH